MKKIKKRFILLKVNGSQGLTTSDKLEYFYFECLF
jgi:hypothetical protein